MIEKRNLIIFGSTDIEYNWGLKYFKRLNYYQLKELLECKVYDPYPWLRYMEYIWFMYTYGKKNEMYLHGFVYSPDRMGKSDRQCGIMFEGIGSDIKWTEEQEEAKKVFEFLFGDANEYNIDPPWAWFD